VNTYLVLLRNYPAYLRLWIAQAVSLLGDWFTTIALSSLVAHYTNGSGIAVSLLLLSRIIPQLAVGPLAGVLVDRLNRKHLLIFSDVLRVGIVLMFLTITGPDKLWLIYLLSALQFSLSALFEPCRSAMIPSLVGPNDLVAANTLGSITWSVMLAAGAVIGGAVTALVGSTTALLMDALTFAVSAALLASIPYKPSTTILTQAQKDTRGFIDGLRYVIAHPATAAVLLVKFGGNIGNIDILMVFYATQLFVIGENGTGSLGILYSAFGIGAVLGPLLLNRFNNHSVARMRRLIIVGYAWITLGWVLLGGAPTLLLAALAITVKAMGSAVYWTYSSVILQQTVPDHYLGRLFSLDQWGFQFASTLSAVAMGWLIDQASLRSGISLIGALNALHTGTLSYIVQPTDVRLIAFGTAAASIIPLVLWIITLPWIEQQRISSRHAEIADAPDPAEAAAD
jgi:MFS family permease